MARFCILVVLLLLLASLFSLPSADAISEPSKPFFCGYFSPLDYFNAAFSFQFTSEISFPLFTVVPALAGCTPSKAQVSNPSDYIEYTYFPGLPFLASQELVSGSNVRSFFYDYEDLGNEYLLTSYNSYDQRQNTSTMFNYNPSNLDQLLSYEGITFSSESMMQDQSIIDEFMLGSRHHRRFLNQFDNSNTTLLVQSVWQYENAQASWPYSSTFYINGVSQGTVNYAYEMTKGGLITKIVDIMPTGNISISFSYSNDFKQVKSFCQEDIRVSICFNFNYDTQGRVSSIQNSNGHTIAMFKFTGTNSTSKIQSATIFDVDYTFTN